MDKDAIQRLKRQLNETRRWFYLGAQKKLGVDITGIPLPREDETVSGGLQEQHHAAGSYDYLEPTAFDHAQAEEHMQNTAGDSPTPKIYLAMGNFLNHAVEFLEMKQKIAEDTPVEGMATREHNLEHALKEVENAGKSPPFPEAKTFVDEVVHHARVAHVLVTSEKPISMEVAELTLEQRQANGR